jgi:hypothetical protein
MKKYGILFFLLSPLMVIAQKDRENNRGWKFHSINQAGLLQGQAGSAFQFQTINGFQHRSWFGGVGLGLDYYRFRGIPLFLDVRKAFGKSANRFFIYADGGIHFSWVTDKQKNSILYVTPKNFSSGFYTDAGTGYAIRIDKKNSLLFSAGYTFKSMKATVFDTRPLAWDGAPFTDIYHYALHRIVIKVGWAL